MNRNAIEEEAARWVLRRDREGDTPAFRAALAAWLAEDPRREGILLPLEASWATLDMLDDAAMPEAPPRRASLRRWTFGGAGAAIAAALAILFLHHPGTSDFRTRTGEIRQVRLADNSSVAINSDSRVEVALSAHRRAVSMDEGEAWFRVAHDRTRPFVVTAGPIHVEAVGTAFSVRRREAGADVLVTEGTVRVWTDGAEDRARLIHAGAGVFVADDASIGLIASAPTAVERRLAWRTGELDLAGDTLAGAVAEMNRYNTRKVTLGDASLGARRLHGIFRLDDPEGFARAAAVALGVTVGRDGNAIVLSDGATSRNRSAGEAGRR